MTSSVLLRASCVSFSAIFGAGCLSTAASEVLAHTVRIDFLTGDHYTELNKSVGQQTCILGRLSIDSSGVYYRLQAPEKGDVLDAPFSRIDIGLDRITASRQGLRDGKKHKVCGSLQETTKFGTCDAVRCKSYRLDAPKPQRDGSG